MGQRKRQRTAQRHATEIDRKALDIADEAIREHNFHKLVSRGVIVFIPPRKEDKYSIGVDMAIDNQERTEQCQKGQ